MAHEKKQAMPNNLLKFQTEQTHPQWIEEILQFPTDIKNTAKHSDIVKILSIIDRVFLSIHGRYPWKEFDSSTDKEKYFSVLQIIFLAVLKQYEPTKDLSFSYIDSRKSIFSLAADLYKILTDEKDKIRFLEIVFKTLSTEKIVKNQKSPTSKEIDRLKKSFYEYLSFIQFFQKTLKTDVSLRENFFKSIELFYQNNNSAIKIAIQKKFINQRLVYLLQDSVKKLKISEKPSKTKFKSLSEFKNELRNTEIDDEKLIENSKLKETDEEIIDIERFLGNKRNLKNRYLKNFKAIIGSFFFFLLYIPHIVFWAISSVLDWGKKEKSLISLSSFIKLIFWPTELAKEFPESKRFIQVLNLMIWITIGALLPMILSPLGILLSLEFLPSIPGALEMFTGACGLVYGAVYYLLAPQAEYLFKDNMAAVAASSVPKSNTISDVGQNESANFLQYLFLDSKSTSPKSVEPQKTLAHSNNDKGHPKTTLKSPTGTAPTATHFPSAVQPEKTPLPAANFDQVDIDTTLLHQK